MLGRTIEAYVDNSDPNIGLLEGLNARNHERRSIQVAMDILKSEKPSYLATSLASHNPRCNDKYAS